MYPPFTPEEEQFIQEAEGAGPEEWYEVGLRYLWGEDGVPENPERAFRWFSRAAEEDHTKSQYKLGMMYEGERGKCWGTDTPASYELAVHWYQLAAGQGDIESQSSLARIHQEGFLGAQDLEQAAHYYELAAQNEIEEHDNEWTYDTRGTARYELGQLYRDGRGVEQDYQQARHWFVAAFGDGHSQPAFELGKLYDAGMLEADGDEDGAGIWFYRAAERGLPIAAYQLGKIYADGGHYPDEFEDDLNWLQELIGLVDLAGGEHIEALREDFRRDRIERWWRSAAERACIKAQYKLGRLYLEDWFAIPCVSEYQRKKRGFRWIRKAVRAGHVKAFRLLARLYANGEGTLRNREKSLKWYRKAARKGGRSMKFKIGAELYEGESPNGDNGLEDEEEGLKWIRKSAAQGHPEALNYCFEEVEICGDPDLKLLVILCRKAVENGNLEGGLNWLSQTCVWIIEAMEEDDVIGAAAWSSEGAFAALRLGKMYLNGKGDERNTQKADDIISRFLELGGAELIKDDDIDLSEDIFYELGERFEFGDGVTKDLQRALFWYRLGRDREHGLCGSKCDDLE
jgi:TPR repeat protein